LTDKAGYAPIIPVHLGLILDGNRRWARAHDLPQLEGHRRGYERLFDIVHACADRGIQFISCYVFSTENWDRSRKEVGYLMNLLVWVLTKDIDRFMADGLKLVVLGSRARLSKKVLAAIVAAETTTSQNRRATVALCLNYGGQTEMAEGVARMMRDGVAPDEVTPARLSEYLYHPEIPSIDLVIRTSGEQRLSGFMIWRAQYAELVFVDATWPDFTEPALDAALGEYAMRKRRFGK
jgi:undecaprenyl diphosphate synthase